MLINTSSKGTFPIDVVGYGAGSIMFFLRYDVFEPKFAERGWNRYQCAIRQVH